MKIPHYQLVDRGRLGELLADHTYHTPIKGHDVAFTLPDKSFRCRLTPDGNLTVYKGSRWDFGSRAIDTPAMVAASLMHDAGCHMTNYRVLPWDCRAQFDDYFRKILKDAGNGLWRYARWTGVTLYSQLIARWKDKHEISNDSSSGVTDNLMRD